MMRFFPGFVKVVIILVAMAGSAYWVEAGKQRSPEEIAARRQKVFQQKLDTVLENIWWNDADVVERLSLSESQRNAMSAAFSQQRRRSLEISMKRREIRIAYGISLGSGDWKEAKVLASRMALLTGDMDKTRMLEKISVLEQLNAKQLKVFKETYPRLLSRSWIQKKARKTGPRGKSRVNGGSKS